MTITIEAKKLRAAAAEAATVVAGAGTVPILANVLLEASAPVSGQATLRLCSTDLDMVLERTVTIDQGEAMKVTVPAKLLAAIAGKLPTEAQVSLTLQEGEGETKARSLVIAAGRSRFTLQTLPADQFPEFPEGEWDAEFEIGAAELGTLIDSTLFAASTEETRYYLNGLYFHALNGDQQLLRVAATDGHRLARFQMPLPEGAGSLPKPGVIVPRKAAGLIRKHVDAMVPAAEGAEAPKIAIAVSSQKIRVDFGDTVLTSKLIDGTFPDYSRVIPTGNDKSLKVDKAVLHEAVERVATIASERTRAVAVNLDKDVARLEVTSPEAGKAVEEVPAEYAAEQLLIGFNARYLLDILGHVPGNDLIVEFGDAQAPTLLRSGESPMPPEGPAHLFVLMPMRV